MKINYDIIRSELERIARNCEYYQNEGDIVRLVNEIGCLRGAMYIADVCKVIYPQQKYYDQFIKPCGDAIRTHLQDNPVFVKMSL